MKKQTIEAIIYTHLSVAPDTVRGTKVALGLSDAQLANAFRGLREKQLIVGERPSTGGKAFVYRPAPNTTVPKDGRGGRRERKPKEPANVPA